MCVLDEYGVEYCADCQYPLSHGDDGRVHCQCPEPCPCCGDDPKVNCVYDTAISRHLKNVMNGKDDEQWVLDGIR